MPKKIEVGLPALGNGTLVMGPTRAIGRGRPRTSRPLLLVIVLPLLMQLVGSVFNIWYNTFHVVPLLDAAQKDTFEQTIVLFNCVAYPTFIGIWVYAVLRLRQPLQARHSGQALPAEQATAARRAAVHLPWWTLGVTAGGWVLCIPALLIPLATGPGRLDPQVFVHLPISIAIAGLMSVTQGVFVVELAAERRLFPLLFDRDTLLEIEGVHPLSLRGRGMLWLFSVAVCPVLSLLLLLVGSDMGADDRLFATAVSGVGIAFAFGSAWLMARLLVEPVERLRHAARDVAAGRLDTHIDMLRADEFGPLIHEFNAMIAELRQQQRLRIQLTDRTRALERTTGELERVARQRAEATEHLRSALSVAEQASRAKSEFLANMSHELRTPLSAILGFAEILEDEEVPGETRREFTAAIEKSGRHLLSIINDVLDLSAIQSGRLPVQRVPTRLSRVLDEVLALVRVEAARRGLTLEVDIANDVPQQIDTDPLRLKQALLNLAGNAVKFTENGRISLRVSLTDGATAGRRLVRLEVDDTGPGIPPEKIDEIFDPFTLGDMSATRRHEGTGLGLSIARHIAGLLGGDLTVSSKLGTGSRFTLTIAGDSAA